MATSELRLAVKSALTPAEFDDVAALVREARWNQLAADWRIFIARGRVYAVQTDEGRIVATTATLPYGSRFAWISMVLVAGEFRRRGLATRLMRWAMDDLAAARLVPVLDATPDGREVYRRLGFQDSWGFQRLARREPPTCGRDIRRGAGRAHRSRSPTRTGRHCAPTTPQPSAPNAAPCLPTCAGDCPRPRSLPSAPAASWASCSGATVRVPDTFAH